MWFQLLITGTAIIVILYFFYEYVRKNFFPSDEDFMDSTELREKIQELKEKRADLEQFKYKVQIADEIVAIDNEMKIYEELLAEIEDQS